MPTDKTVQKVGLARSALSGSQFLQPYKHIGRENAAQFHYIRQLAQLCRDTN